eukprot:COSAG01_NODE_5812_length_4018_cov_5.428936_5_plen_92_part_01
MVKRSNEMLLPFYFRDIGAEPSSTPLVCPSAARALGAFGSAWAAHLDCVARPSQYRGGAVCVQVGGGRAAQLAAAWSAGVRVLCVLHSYFRQ